MQKNIYRIIVMGPQGSGKGTQADLLGDKLHIPHISPGNLFRNHIRNGTEIGEIAEAYTTKGKMVPTETTIKMVIERLKQDDCKNGFVLDGFPRNREQFDALDEFIKITHAIEIWISDEEGVERLGQRLSSRCGEVYHLKYNPPKKEGVCDECGEKLYVRKDDKPEAIKLRLKIYHEKTEPLVELYKKQGVHIKINGEQSIEDIYQEISKKLSL